MGSPSPADAPVIFRLPDPGPLPTVPRGPTPGPAMTLPPSSDALADATFDDLARYYDALRTAPLDAAGAPEWLATWSALDELVDEAATRAMIAYTGDTENGAKEAAHLRWSAELLPRLHEHHVALARRLLDVGYTTPTLETTLRRFRTDAELFREANVPIEGELEELAASYQRITGGLAVDWDGERKTIPQLQPFLKVADRGVRERAFGALTGAYLAHRDELAGLFDEMFERRTRLARNAGFDTYEAFAFRAKYRDYTPDDCRALHRAIEEAVVPAVERLHEHRRSRLGVDTLRPWDTGVDLEGDEPLRPFAAASELADGASRIFHAVDPDLGAQFDTMARAGLLDLESRPGKAPGAYCTELSHRGVPFIFMNAVGIPDDVSTVLHEAGHCFHDFAKHRLPLVWQRSVGSEAAELASMSMELLAARHLPRPTGFYSEGDARRARIEQLEDILVSLAHIASIDAFQSWIYTSGEGGRADARDAAWLEIRGRFERGLDWSGLDAERVSRWYRQLHIFEYPFYYIEYGIAQLGALQVWRESLTDPAAAIGRYKAALALGGTRPLHEIYRAAGARLVFDGEGIRELVALVEEQLHAMQSTSA